MDVMARFGRPVWYTLSANNHPSIIELAKAKLNPKHDFLGDEHAKLACFSIRIGLDFDATCQAGRNMEVELVESHMRVALIIPQHREFIRAGAPSEPILAEAAAQLLDVERSEELAPGTLCQALDKGFLGQEERSTMIGRLLWTLAHDKLLRDRRTYEKVRFHKPIHVLDFLRSLFHESHWSVVLNAKPIGDENGLPLSEAFKDAHICFSHFTDGRDHDVDLRQVYELLLRGAALSCGRKRTSVDFLTPIIFGSPDTTDICDSNTSVLQAQVNVESRHCHEKVLVNSGLVQSEFSHPVLSLVHEFGTEGRKQVVENTVPDLNPGQLQSYHARHYQIVAYGCSSDTYGVIPRSMDAKYLKLLGSNLLMEDFPRADIDECVDLFHKMDASYALKLGGSQGGDWFGKDRVSPRRRDGQGKIIAEGEADV